ncbi:alanine racemase [Lentzea flaviverrucosa]|uniref:Alanine racemase n=1 Tax=Lentzea flaviverrucosa TaxID=200379 RepID=A0A1H9XY77_9PSEU|nr:alanine racemase [Lentzea flaviverrucosa]RDI30181.1 alanine racemase [Lentzea flaviverrucosa]SES51170.1 alanine racemase [Lentzea flaviverrucosa]
MARSEVVVDLGALRHNVALLAGLAPASETMAVVKADGYGHGAVQVARAALEAGATWLGSCSTQEALALRSAGIQAPVLAWLDAPDEDLAAGLAADVDMSVSSLSDLRRIEQAALEADARPRLHLKIDTGLSRNGCQPHDWPELVEAAKQHEVVAIWSHLASADEIGDPSIDLQAKRFDDAYEVAKAAGLDPKRHIANSAALLTRPDLHFDIVRPGIAVYGLNPVPTDHDLRPVMSYRSHVALTKRIPAGESVSYGMTWTARTDTTLALVPAGYADGVPRALSGRMEVLLDGRRRPVVGRVCMDQIVVDCGDDEIAEGAEVVLFGDGSRGEPTATEWAELTGTIDYEIVCGMYRPRVRRIYT